MKIINRLVRTKYFSGARRLWVDSKNPSLMGHRVFGEFRAFGGGKTLDPKEAARQFMRLGLTEMAQAVSPETSLFSLACLAMGCKDEVLETIKGNLKRRGTSEEDLNLMVQLISEKQDEAFAALERLREHGIPEAEIMQGAAKSPNKEIRMIAARAVETPNNILFCLAEREDRESKFITEAALNNLISRNVSGAELARIMDIMDKNVLRGYFNLNRMIANSPFAREKALSRLIEDGGEGYSWEQDIMSGEDRIEIAEAAVQNLRQRNVPESGIMRLAARSRSYSINLMAAVSPHTSEKDLFAIFRQHNYISDRIAPAAIKNLRERGIDEARIMAEALDAASNSLRLMAAESPDTPQWALVRKLREYEYEDRGMARVIIEKLLMRGLDKVDVMRLVAGSGKIGIRKIAAESPDTPIEILMDLIRRDYFTAEAAFNNLRDRGVDESLLISCSVKSGRASVIKFALESDATRAEDLFYLMRLEDEYEYEPELIVSNLRRKGIPEREIMRAAAEGGQFLKEIAANSDNTPLENLLKLTEYKWEKVAQAALENMTRRGFIDNEPQTVEKMKLFGECRFPELKLVAAKSSLTPNDILFKLSNDKDPSVAAAAKKTLVGLIGR